MHLMCVRFKFPFRKWCYARCHQLWKRYVWRLCGRSGTIFRMWFQWNCAERCWLSAAHRANFDRTSCHPATSSNCCSSSNAGRSSTNLRLHLRRLSRYNTKERRSMRRTCSIQVPTMRLQGRKWFWPSMHLRVFVLHVQPCPDRTNSKTNTSPSSSYA